ncbi:hypothetical protein J2W32_000044 [Variovorax boronicumulans]|uniref:Uncharacterized protein n=1 Tax=Variovorax boronicumulans TaxID=436515 RepID=A0AAW8CQY4_9BURK|nr:hypothetical protein [Variovorax boronicumulans]MDP9890948.1 hypothetical protein [Variovorax boronicumulans]MDQ0051015.1 hypothetical protein [Variovorax boronicumulans]
MTNDALRTVLGDWCLAGNTVRHRSSLLRANAAAYDPFDRENQRTTSFITQAPLSR